MSDPVNRWERVGFYAAPILLSLVALAVCVGAVAFGWWIVAVTP